MEQYQSQDITTLAKALLTVQKVLQPAVKDRLNPFVNNMYATLNSVMDVCRDPLLDNGIWLCQYPVPLGNEVAHAAHGNCLGLVTKLTHAESGQWQASLAVVPLAKADPQGMGSAMTYARRYALSAMLGIVTEEDLDGESDNPNEIPNQNQSYPQNTPGANVRQKSEQRAQKPEQTNSTPQNKPNAGANKGRSSGNLPTLNGVIYESLQGQDEKGNVREIITATGNTIPNKDQLAKVGFRWNPNKKYWWRYAEAV